MEPETRIEKKFEKAFKDEGRSKSWVADQLAINVSTLSRILSGKYKLSERNRKKLNEILGTSIGDPDE
jgi:ribosome-binding protein aMBF1 (putative translation factor)